MKISLYLTALGARFWTSSAGLTLEESFAGAASLGFDAVEIMPRALDDPDPKVLKALSERYRLPVLGLASGFLAADHGLTFTDPDAGVRRQAVDGVCRCIDAARFVGAPLCSIGIVRGKLHPGVSREEALAHLLACIRETGLRAQQRGITLLLEPGNRYETDFVHTVAEAIEVLDAVGLPSVRLMVDTFHMNIEEASIGRAVRRAGPHLAHVHFADSNRRAPGWGHLDFVAVAQALREAGYAGAIGLEMTLVPDFEAAARQGLQAVRRLFG